MTAEHAEIRQPEPGGAAKSGLQRRLRLYWSMIRYGNAHNRDFAREHFAFFEELRAYVPDLADKRVLDVGCGKSMWLTLLLHSYGAKATGVDTEVMEPQSAIAKYWSILRENGPERALRTFAGSNCTWSRPGCRERRLTRRSSGFVSSSRPRSSSPTP